MSRADTLSRPDTPEDRERERNSRLATLSPNQARHVRNVPDQPITYLIFSDRAVADEVLAEIGATADDRLGGVRVWDDRTGAALGSFEDASGRVAVGHPWTAEERTWLADYLDGWRSASIVRALPADWVVPDQDTSPERPNRRS